METTLRVLGTTPHHASVIELRSARAVRRLLQGLSHSESTAPDKEAQMEIYIPA
jgi:hypothetical protein